MRTKRTAAFATSLVVAGALLAGCAAGGTPEEELPPVSEDGLVIDGELIADAELLAAARDEGRFVFYTGGSASSEEALAVEFIADTGVYAEIVRLAPNRLNERILSEQGAGQLGADAIRSTGEGLIIEIAEAGAFEKHVVPSKDELLSEAIIDDGLYYRTFDRVYSFAYNNQLVDEKDAPKDWADLLDPRWEGQLGIVQVDGGGSTAALTRFMFEELGEDYLRDFAALKPRIFDSSGALSDALARGEITAGAMPVATGYSSILEGAPLTIALPKEGVAAFASYLGVAAGADSPAAAQLFVNWVLSKRGQTAVAATGDYPVRADVPAPTIGDVELPAVDSDFVYRTTAQEAIDNTAPDSKLWREIFGYTG